MHQRGHMITAGCPGALGDTAIVPTIPNTATTGFTTWTPRRWLLPRGSELWGTGRPPALELEEGTLPATADIPPDQTTVTYTVVASGSQRGKPKLFDSLGYGYVVNKVDFMWFMFIITACWWPFCLCRVVKPHGTPSLATAHFSNISLATIGLP